MSINDNSAQKTYSTALLWGAIVLVSLMIVGALYWGYWIFSNQSGFVTSDTTVEATENYMEQEDEYASDATNTVDSQSAATDNNTESTDNVVEATATTEISADNKGGEEPVSSEEEVEAWMVTSGNEEDLGGSQDLILSDPSTN